MRNLTPATIFRATLLTALLAGAGCGSSSSSDAAAKFTGAWAFNPGTATCTTGAISFPVTGLAVTITESDSMHIALSAGSGCTINFSVSGATATAASGQSCTLQFSGVSQTITVSSWTLMLAGDQITNNASGTATICPLTVTGTLVKGTADAGTSG
jgi:hypothetical protein